MPPPSAVSENGIRIPIAPAPPNSSAYADQAKEATTPRLTRVSMVAAACRRPRSARRWKPAEPQLTTGSASPKQTHCQPGNCADGTIDSTSTGTASSAVTSSRHRSPASSAAGPADSTPSGANSAV